MSEYQYIEFRAVDRPLTDGELDFAQAQSTRAEITRWSFRNEYHFGDFRGDAEGLLRHGYDVHLHYANFGIRKAMFRLPAGLPFPESVWSEYFEIAELQWKPDEQGKSGILSVARYHEPGSVEELYDPGEYMDDLIEIRNRLVSGDLRALYALWLCTAMSEDSYTPELVEPPVPAGLAECADDFAAVLEYFGCTPFILQAAAEGTTDAPPTPSLSDQCCEWLKGLNETEMRRLLTRFLVEDAAGVQAETIAQIGQAAGHAHWPTVRTGRTLGQLEERADQLLEEARLAKERQREAEARRAAERKERERQERMRRMVQDPQTWIREAEKLVEQRGIANYIEAAQILADLREALGGEDGIELTRRHAAHLAQQHPTLHHLKSQLRKRDLLN